jgi:hypothetical protein
MLANVNRRDILVRARLGDGGGGGRPPALGVQPLKELRIGYQIRRASDR